MNFSFITKRDGTSVNPSREIYLRFNLILADQVLLLYIKLINER